MDAAGCPMDAVGCPIDAAVASMDDTGCPMDGAVASMDSAGNTPEDAGWTAAGAEVLPGEPIVIAWPAR